MQKFEKSLWRVSDYQELVTYLQKVGEKKYAAFSKKLIPGEFCIYGVRLPILRRLAKIIARGDWRAYVTAVKNKRGHEEILLEGLVISELSLLNYEEATTLMWKFSGQIFNWAIADCFINRKFLSRHQELFWRDELDKYLSASNIWRIRVGILIMMTYYLDQAHIKAVFEKILKIKSQEYYVAMAIAWLLATAMVKNRSATLEFFKRLPTQENNLPIQIRKMAAQKIRDSRRVTPEDKVLVTQLLN